MQLFHESFNLETKTALVTGAGRGIGAGCALQLARAGAFVILNDHPESRDVRTTAASIKKECGRRNIVIRANYFKESDRKELLKKTISACGQIDILVCNPYYSYQNPAIKWPMEKLKEVFDKVFFSHFHMAQLVAQAMKDQKDLKDKCIIFISSEFGTNEMIRDNSVGYDCAKAALIKLTKILAREWIDYKIRVNTIAPGATNTPGERDFAPDEELRKSWKELPAKRACEPLHIGMEAVCLAANEMINGSVRIINGGEHLF